MLNSLYIEPYSRCTKLMNCLLVGGEHDTYKQLEILSELTFEKFEAMRKEWLKTLSFEWLIQGQISQFDATEIALKAKEAIDHTSLKTAI